MKTFLKWSIGAFFMLNILVAIQLSNDDLQNGNLKQALIILAVGSIGLGLIFYWLEIKYMPQRKIKLMSALIKLFDAKPIAPNIVRFKLGGLHFLAEVSVQLSIAPNSGAFESIGFHVEQGQYDRLTRIPNFKKRPARCNGLDTYLVYQTSGMWLKLAKKRLTKKLFP